MNTSVILPAKKPADRQIISNGMLEANYPRNMWWMAAWTHEITDKPTARTLLDRAIVLYRGASGSAVALDDRCPHRSAPLSEGRVCGDALACPYHGLKFGPDGTCIEVPTQKDIPKTLRVASYPLMERKDIIWIWLGDKSAIEQTPHPPDELAPDSTWTTIRGYFRLDFNYVLLRENVIDLTHLPFVHSATFGQTDWIKVPEVEFTDTSVRYKAEFPNSNLTPVFGGPMGILPGKRVDRFQVGEMITPAVSYSRWIIKDRSPEPGERSDFEMRAMHIATPISPNETHYFWSASYDMLGISNELLEESRSSITFAFQEDAILLAKLHKNVKNDPRGLDYPEVNLGADKAGIHVRRILQRYLQQESQ